MITQQKSEVARLFRQQGKQVFECCYGKEITIDYGTFAIVEGEDNKFQCRCGSIDCRRILIMNIAVLFEDYNSSEHYLKNLEPARNVAKFDKTNLHTYHHVPLKKLDAIKRVKDLILSKKYDLFINLCEAAVSSDVSIPDFVTVESMEELREDRLEKLGMPLLVKHATGHDSLGMTDESRVTSRQQLFLQVEQMLKHFGGAATIEQFIDGPEYTVLVVENADDENDPVVFTPVQCHFSNGHTFKHFDLKWTDYNNVKYAPVIDQKLAQNLKEASKRIFMTCHGAKLALRPTILGAISKSLGHRPLK
uniref:ATP-grasp domain-containing protein n=1 Tax=Romanomermis culicivorax TaxID=13658 RepID=A0A915HL84_ROMCU